MKAVLCFLFYVYVATIASVVEAAPAEAVGVEEPAPQPLPELEEEEETGEEEGEEAPVTMNPETLEMVQACEDFKEGREVCLNMTMTDKDLAAEEKYDRCLLRAQKKLPIEADDIVIRADTDRGECWKDLKPIFDKCFIPMAAQMQRDDLDDYVERVKICEPLDSEDELMRQ